MTMSKFNVVRRRHRTDSLNPSTKSEVPIVSTQRPHEDDDECALTCELEDPWRQHASLEGCQGMSFRRR